MEAALVQPACGHPDAHAVVRQHLQTRAVLVGKQVGRVRVCRTEHRHYARQSLLSARTHVHGRDGQAATSSALKAGV